MLFLIIFVLCVAIVLYSKKVGSESGTVLGAIIAFCSIVALIAVFSVGINVYPDCVGKQQHIFTLKRHVEEIRNAHYKEVKSGTLIGGSLDNVKQSQILSEYLINLASETARYNEKIEEYKTSKKLFINNLTGCSFFVSDKIYELKTID